MSGSVGVIASVRRHRKQLRRHSRFHRRLHDGRRSARDDPDTRHARNRRHLDVNRPPGRVVATRHTAERQPRRCELQHHVVAAQRTHPSADEPEGPLNEGCYRADHRTALVSGARESRNRLVKSGRVHLSQRAGNALASALDASPHDSARSSIRRYRSRRNFPHPLKISPDSRCCRSQNDV
jgi:hypothetical protein